MQAHLKKHHPGVGLLTPCAAAALLALFSTGPAQAFQIETDNPSLSMSFDNTLRYNLGVRTGQRNDFIGNSSTYDEGDYSFDRGEIVTNRLDLMSEFNLDYDRRFGFRVSGAAWADAAYDGQSKANPALAGQNNNAGGNFSSYTKRYYRGPSGEWLDAYAYTNFDLGSAKAKLSVGRQTVLWGEAQALSTHSVSYSQAPTDVRKALATPGATAKEISMPVGQVAGNVQVNPELNVAAQYYYDWAPNRLPEGGTYLGGITDFFFLGPTSLGPFSNGGMKKPKKAGEFGFAARWAPEWLDGTVGVYAREFTERNFWFDFNTMPGSYRYTFAEKNRLYGVSLQKSILGITTGAELVVRRNTALVSAATDAAGQGARGNTYHALINGIYSTGAGPFYQSAIFIAELAYSRLDKTTSNEALFNGCAALSKDIRTGCATRDNSQLFLVFAPNFGTLSPGWDLTGSVAGSYGLHGNSSVPSGGNRHNGSYSVGAGLEYNRTHRFNLAYNGYMGEFMSDATKVTAANGLVLKDRGWLSFTYQIAF